MRHQYENYLKTILQRKQIPVDESQWNKMKQRLMEEGLTQDESIAQTARSSSKKWSMLLLAGMLVGIFAGWALRGPITASQPASSTEIPGATASQSLPTIFDPTGQYAPAQASPAQEIRYIYMPMPMLAQQSASTTHPDKGQKINQLEAHNLPISPLANFTRPIAKTTRVISLPKESKSAPKEMLDKYNELLKAELARNQNPLAFEEPTSEPSTNYGIKGGLFSGTNQSGYSGTFHVEHDLGSNFMLESDLGLINSLGSVGSVMPSVSAKTNSNGLSVTPDYGLLYENLEPNSNIISNENVRYTFSVINPSAGYSLNELVTLKMGIDMQALMTRSENNTYIQVEDKYFRMAKFDFGLTPKVNVKLSPKLSGEFVYRNGINGSIMGSEYWNRNYFFAQLQLNLR